MVEVVLHVEHGYVAPLRELLYHAMPAPYRPLRRVPVDPYGDRVPVAAEHPAHVGDRLGLVRHHVLGQSRRVQVLRAEEVRMASELIDAGLEGVPRPQGAVVKDHEESSSRQIFRRLPSSKFFSQIVCSIQYLFQFILCEILRVQEIFSLERTYVTWHGHTNTSSKT